jgi:outer membrane receptor protein involved in Fe transport
VGRRPNPQQSFLTPVVQPVKNVVQRTLLGVLLPDRFFAAKRKSHAMSTKLYSLLSLCLLLLLTGSLFGQNRVTLTGTVLESAGRQPVEFATVMAKDAATQQMVGGTTTNLEGQFALDVPSRAVVLEVSFIGYLPQTISEIPEGKGTIDLGTILLDENSQTLEEVVVQAERSSTEFRLDKRVFNVGQDLSSTGASALEVLDNVPSVNVNIEGQISLRGSVGVQVLINGKPSVLASEEGNALGTITADMIERIEVITNPSAKYEAEGTSGIINIVIKKDERKGLNGSVSVNTGWPHNHSVGLSLNRRTERFNLFTQMGGGYRSLPRFRENINQNLETGTTILSDGVEYRNEQFYNFILGSDFYINEYNVITLSGNFAYEIEDQPSETDFQLLDANNEMVSEWTRTEVTEATNPKWQYELNYTKEFRDNEDHKLLFSAVGNLFAKDQASEFNNQTTGGDLVDGLQQTLTDFGETRNTIKLDYTRPFTDKITLETGAQYFLNHVRNDFSVSNRVNGEWVPDPGLTNIFIFDQKVFGVYATGAYEGDKWGVKGGLRMEHTNLETLLETTGEENTQNFPNFFPSFHTSYKFTERFSMQAGYSRRIFRPRLWDLNPFFNIRNNFSIRMGNPDLMPEFTDSYEVNGILILDKLSTNLGVYHRFTTEVVERVSTFEDNVNIFRPINVGTNQSTGIEFNAKYIPAKWLTIDGDFNYNYFQRQGTFEGTSFDFSADQWSTKWRSKFKLPFDFDVEITGRYQSDVRTIQGVVSANLWADAGIRKKLMDGKAVINFSVRDIFFSRFRETEILQEDFYVYSFGQRGRFLTLGFSYGFGKGEAMEYSGRRR